MAKQSYKSLKSDQATRLFPHPFFLETKVERKWSAFRTEKGGWNFLSPPTRNLEIEYGCYISYLHVTEHKYVSSKCCLEILSQIAIGEDVRFLLPSCFCSSPPSQNPDGVQTDTCGAFKQPKYRSLVKPLSAGCVNTVVGC